MLSVFIIGNGRLAKNLANTFSQSDIEIRGIFSRSLATAQKFGSEYSVPHFSDLSRIPVDCDVYFLAISDQAIAEVSNQINVNGIVVHCSGMASISILSKHKQTGVFWPIQTFSNSHFADFAKIPICIETLDENDHRILEVIADKIGNKTITVKEIERQKLHLAAVLVNNYTNHLFVLAEKFLSKNELPFDIMMPLIHETVSKLDSLSPALAQTGPAVRNDSITIEKHKTLIADNPNLLALYEKLCESILQNKS